METDLIILRLDRAKLNVVWAALMKLPGEVAYQVAKDIEIQVASQERVRRSPSAPVAPEPVANDGV
jgi:hypothetical protein